ncbi:MAG: aspartyl/glutamyl-tRNA amidotransferase subunit C [Candidatus Gracilibacteria bacterium]|nr:aspartyl/glutamyl-tRNA amidotransferase subunit C [Candidatus Gracilibacteria bacterium]
MTITQEILKNITHNLSKLKVAHEEKILGNVNDLLNYMDTLNQVDTTGVIPTISVIDSKSKLRVDTEKEKEVKIKELLACSPQKVINNQIAISNIMH